MSRQKSLLLLHEKELIVFFRGVKCALAFVGKEGTGRQTLLDQTNNYRMMRWYVIG